MDDEQALDEEGRLKAAPTDGGRGGHDVRTDGPPERQRPQPEEVPLRILYEDDTMLVLDKPAGMVVHPTYRNSSGTLLNGVLWHLRNRPGTSPGILTRLDKDTSGLVVIGISAAVHATMQKDGGAGRLIKEYLAIVHGTPSPSQGIVTLPLGRDTADRRVVVVREDGQACETRYETIEAQPGMSALRCQPITGRTHQIRVHLASNGWPIVGDRVYGSPGVAAPSDISAPRQALHAWTIRLPHPVTRQAVSFVAPLPDDLRELHQRFTPLQRIALR